MNKLREALEAVEPYLDFALNNGYIEQTVVDEVKAALAADDVARGTMPKLIAELVTKLRYQGRQYASGQFGRR